MSNTAFPTLTRFGNGFTENTEKVRISVVVPVYKVRPYFPDLLDSLAAQEQGQYELEFVFVEDGCPDNSGELALEWLSKDNRSGVVVQKANGGVSAARNSGIELATGDWVTMPDSDDFLNARYFTSFVDLVRDSAYDDVNIIANNIHRYFESDETFRDNHALKFKFENGSRVVDLDVEPHMLQIHIGSTFIKREFLVEHAIRFDPRIAASEDALFVIEVLLESDRPLLGINSESVYFYRKRAAGDSAVDTFSQKRESYFDRFQYGFLEIFERVAAERATIPNWAMTVILYEFRWLFDAEIHMHQKEKVLGSEGRREFLLLAQKLLSFVSEDAIRGYKSGWLGWELRMLFLALKGIENPDSWSYVRSYDHERQLYLIEYWFTGDLPEEEFTINSKIVEPTAGKIQKLDYFGQEILKKRIVWLKGHGNITVTRNNVPSPMTAGVQRNIEYGLTETSLDKHFARRAPDRLVAAQKVYSRRKGLRRHLMSAYREWYAAKFAEKTVSSLSKQDLYQAQRGILARVRRAAWSPESREKFENAWVFMDRVAQAQDNAEHLYRWTASNFPEVNIWYVLKKDSSDWQRLESEGFKLIDYRSLDHYKVMMNAQHLISSHLDYDVVEPIPRRFYVNSLRPWKLTFLQHGIIMNDMSMWLNQKQIDLMVTSTVSERNSIIGDFTNYKLTGLTVKQTGLPRFDGLLEKTANKCPKIILIAPTWREFLLAEKTGLAAERSLIPDFERTEYFQNWRNVLVDPRLRQHALDTGLEIVFLPHPGLKEMASLLRIPEYVRVASYSDGDIQDLLTSADLAITDYSSIAFDLVYSGAKLVYFQFDRERVLGGGHIVRPGYFSYDRDGLGPVARDVEGVFEAIAELANGLPVEYQRRIESLDWKRDGRSCERTYNAILDLSR